MREKLTYVFIYSFNGGEKQHEFIDAYGENEAIRKFYKSLGYTNQPIEFEIKTWVDYCPNITSVEDSLIRGNEIALV